MLSANQFSRVKEVYTFIKVTANRKLSVAISSAKVEMVAGRVTCATDITNYIAFFDAVAFLNGRRLDHVQIIRPYIFMRGIISEHMVDTNRIAFQRVSAFSCHFANYTICNRINRRPCGCWDVNTVMILTILSSKTAQNGMPFCGKRPTTIAVRATTVRISTRFHERENLIIVVRKSHPLQRRAYNGKVQITLCLFQTIYATETYSRFQRNNGILVRGRVQVPNDTIGIFGVVIQGIPTATALKNNSHLVITAIAFECPTLIGVVRAGVHCDFFAVVDHVVFMVTVQIYVFAATIVINFIVVIILKSHFIFSYSFLFVPRQKLV